MKKPTYLLNISKFNTSGNCTFDTGVYYMKDEYDKALAAYYKAINGMYVDCAVELRNIETHKTLFFHEQP